MSDGRDIQWPLQPMCADPARAQRSALRAILGANAGTELCRRYGLTATTSREDFARRLPVQGYEAYRPWIERMRKGERDVLVAEPVRFFARTSGTTAEPKLLPITRGWREAQQVAQALLLEELVRDVPPARDRPPFVIASPASEGSVTGVGLVASGGRHGVVVSSAAPASGGTPSDLSALYAAMAEQVCRARPSSLIAASPSSLVVLLDALATGAPERAEVIRGIAALVAWRSGASSLYEGALRARAPHAHLRDVGLAASEGFFTVSIDGSTAAVPLGTHHVIELAPEGGGEPVPLEQGIVGEEYRLIVTTPGGLYRYDTEDIVAVVGRRSQMPLLSFSRRAGSVSSVAGEKLTETQLVGAVRACAEALDVIIEDFTAEVVWSEDGARAGYLARVALGAPTAPSGASEAALAARFADDLDRRLGEWNREYARKRATHRLAAMRIELVAASEFRELRDARRRAGAPDAQYKLLVLRAK
jgi:hypothetical protein